MFGFSLIFHRNKNHINWQQFLHKKNVVKKSGPWKEKLIVKIVDCAESLGPKSTWFTVFSKFFYFVLFFYHQFCLEN